MTAVQERDTGLRHGAIGMADALASTLSNMAPVEGIFIVLVIVAGAMGTLTPWAFMLGAIGMLMVYVFASAITPVYIWRHDRATFSITAHVLPALAGVAVVGYGVYEFVLPSQPSPANTFWAYILALVVLAAIAAAVAVRLRGPAIARLGHVYTGEPAPAPVTAAGTEMAA